MNKLVTSASLSHGHLLVTLSEMDALASEIETDFTERAFAPFWDGVCSFAVKMGRVEADMRLIAQSYRKYNELHTRYLQIARSGDPKPDPFDEGVLNPIDPIALKAITDWFCGIVRKGQRDFQFASIYEHYRTREVLVEGFKELIRKFADISAALNSVNRTLINGFWELNECLSDLQESIGDEFDYLRECIEEEGERNRDAIEEREARQRDRHDELLRGQEYVTDNLERSETGRRVRHEEIISEGRRDRELLKDINKRIGGKEWWWH